MILRMRLCVKEWATHGLPLGKRQPRGPQRPEKRFGHNAADQGKRRQDNPKPAIEHNAIPTGHEPSQPLGWKQVNRILVAECGDNTA